jgi:hypothetical protein
MADKYRVKTGAWNATNSWAESSGGTDYTTTPGSSDNVFFDANTPTDANHDIGGGSCNDIDFTGFTGNLSGGSLFSIGGNIILSSGMTSYFYSQWQINGSVDQSITSNGAKIIGRLLINKMPGTTLTLQDKFYIAGNVASSDDMFNLSSGNFDVNGQEVELLLANSQTYGIKNFTGKFHDFTISFASETPAKRTYLTAVNNFEIEGKFTVKGLYGSRVKIIGTGSTKRTITSDENDFEGVDFEYVKGAGDGDWDVSDIPNGSVDYGNNEDITFKTPETMYFVSGAEAGSISDLDKWRTTSGGETVSNPPLLGDTIVFDANSFDGEQDLELDHLWIGNLDLSNATVDNLAFSVSMVCYDEVDLTGVNSTSGAFAFDINADNDITIKTDGLAIPLRNILSGKATLLDDLESTQTLGLTSGEFDANNKNVKASGFSSSNSNTRTLKMGSGTWELAGDAWGNPWDTTTTTNLTFDKGTATIKLTAEYSWDKTFNGGGLTFNNIECNHTGTHPIFRSNNVWNDFKISAGRGVRFYRGNTQTVNTFNAIGTDGNEITIKSDTTTNAILEKAGGGTITMDYVDIDYITGNPDDTWYASNSIIGENCVQIYELATDDRRRASFMKFF